jgi:hypothetical protein
VNSRTAMGSRTQIYGSFIKSITSLVEEGKTFFVCLEVSTCFMEPSFNEFRLRNFLSGLEIKADALINPRTVVVHHFPDSPFPTMMYVYLSRTCNMCINVEFMQNFHSKAHLSATAAMGGRKCKYWKTPAL